MMFLHMDGDGRRLMGLRGKLGRFAIVAAALIGGVAALPSTASAGLLTQSVDCSPKPTSQVFAPWGDYRNYMLAPGGSFENGAPGWTLRGASVVQGNESFKVGGASHNYSLRLDPGESATSPEICVGLEHPVIRLFAKNNSLLLSTMSVEVIVKTSLGLKVPVPVAVVLPSGKWKPTPAFLVVANLLPLLPGDYTPVSFRFTSVGIGTWWIDDFYVDPRRRI
jgi:hypothetical protein